MPENDFNYKAIRDCANYDENSAPIAKSFGSTWKNLENYLRKLMDTAIIYTGTSSGEVSNNFYKLTAINQTIIGSEQIQTIIYLRQAPNFISFNFL